MHSTEFLPEVGPPFGREVSKERVEILQDVSCGQILEYIFIFIQCKVNENFLLLTVRVRTDMLVMNYKISW